MPGSRASLSMPKGTPPEKLLLASRDFAREQFALKHRYALAMHTDQDHPHVHLVVKAVSEDGKRLNIRKATLREWRGLFAQHLRAQESLPTRPSAQCGARPARVSRTASIAHRYGAIPDICVSESGVLARSFVTEASSQTPERRSSSKLAAM